MQTIPISIQQRGESVPLSVSGGETGINLTPEQLRVVEAVSPTVDATRVEDGVEITVHDLRDTQTVELHDGAQGPQGEPGPAYVLTDEDKQDIINAVLAVYPAAEGVSF